MTSESRANEYTCLVCRKKLRVQRTKTGTKENPPFLHCLHCGGYSVRLTPEEENLLQTMLNSGLRFQDLILKRIAEAKERNTLYPGDEV